MMCQAVRSTHTCTARWVPANSTLFGIVRFAHGPGLQFWRLGSLLTCNVFTRCCSPALCFPALLQVAELGVPYILMHMRGTPQDMQQRRHTAYKDVVGEVAAELAAAAQAAVAAGIEPWRLVLDPGLGFAKTADGNLQLLAQLPALRAALPPPLAGLPLLLGPSRKGFLGRLANRERTEERDCATAAAAALCVAGGASIIRAHNVAAVHDAVRVADAVQRFAL